MIKEIKDGEVIHTYKFRCTQGIHTVKVIAGQSRPNDILVIGDYKFCWHCIKEKLPQILITQMGIGTT